MKTDSIQFGRLVFFCVTLMLIGCGTTEKEVYYEWQFDKNIALDTLGPVGIAVVANQIWLADVDHNRLVQIDTAGMILESLSNIERPMHISSFNNQLLIPSYPSDSLAVYENNRLSKEVLQIQPDGFASISKNNDFTAIADFYNHKVYLIKGQQVQTLGGEGHTDAKMYYPADVQIFDDTLYVADTYNNRVQIFDLDGNLIRILGQEQKIRETTGLKVTTDEIFVTDFGGKRVLVFDKKGMIKQILTQSFDRPADIEILNDKLFVVNYGGKSLSIYKRVAVEKNPPEN
jgi:DNA-binding beta-propeller fold protein YncE